MEMLATVIGVVIKSLIFIVGMFLAAAYLTLIERKFAGHVQQRPGPLHVGFHGLLQPIADALKVLTKEDLVPNNVDKVLFYLASLLAFVPAIMILAVIPFGEPFTIFGIEIKPYITDLNIGLILALAFGSISIYGVIFAGWASNSKYPMIGGLRKAAVLIGYEVALGFAMVGPIMMAGSFSLREIVYAQEGFFGAFIWYQPIAFIVILFAILAETGRTPFDVQEAEAELVSGYNTEYSGMKFGLFPLAEWYIGTFVLSAIAVILFFGGWKGPEIFGALSPFIWFFLKVFMMFMFFLWVHWTLPRYRVDQITEIAWKVMLPLSLLNIFITAIIIMVKG
ncbi:NADH-quinone oxidoreductase subunit NuoH [Sulfurihydrogenibium azorense]|jgi:NADH-quinone oxidoreductase subunit H|uniref:NADH-quinone oxidoreductase subunit H n=1 Tax=Sulfurihydrogenibium azorense (strain DSM 15241 / OCM 825 / Az-Fu1) TaxID=204536 RepID=C1DT42_SULAA|nr:NADH-quinone oxidoreductase subunit NuoH [Sulfurihydrogenibium azorense]ACN99256.1 NADH-quinone oxidoreductase subunit h (nadhdehydrogenase i subunit h) (ndh-1 subunit h) [Sulfurihydrogenibium azorense Az-Fu1]MDM7273389.1 NADH-quinone oxidoreductase subunit NuoH [Sulfurihydrogenibium azorense]